mgnify:FL=1
MATRIEDRRNLSLEAAVADAVARYTAANPASRARHEAASAHLPGGNTRTILHFSPFPLTLTDGEGARLTDADGHVYRDYLGEYTAGLYGHSHPVIRSAIDEALDHGVTLGGPNRWEGELARLMCERFPSLDFVRFCNSGTEANLNALGAARAHTGRDAVLVFDGAYHGGVFVFAGGGSPMNAPFPYVLAPYNDVDATRATIRAHADRLAAVILEPMMGSGGGIEATPDFLAMLRAETAAKGVVLVFDEVMTSRLGPGGLQGEVGITPDLTTFGKYLGGGMSFGAFGGRTEIMEAFDPEHGAGWVHSGTYNNNVLTMAAGVAGLSRVYTPEAARALTAKGDALRARLNATFRHHDVPFQVLGRGSINAVHFHDRPMARPGDAVSDPELQTLFHLELLERGIYLARRGMTTLSLPLTDADDDAFVDAVDDICTAYAPLVRDAVRARQ